MHERIDLVPGAEAALKAANVAGEYQQSFPDFFQARLIPVRQFKLPGFFLADCDRILKLVNLIEVLGIVGVDQGADRHQDIAGADILLGERVRLCVVSDGGDIMIFIDDHEGHKTLAGVGERDRHWRGCEIEHAERIKRVAVQPYDGLVINSELGYARTRSL
jgi:hypothetical protein